MDSVHQGIKRSGKSKYVVSLIRRYLILGRRVATNIDIFLEKLDLPSPRSRRYDGLLIRIPDSPSPQNLWDLGLGSDGEYTDDHHGGIFLDECSLFLGNRSYNDSEQKKLIEFLVHSGKRRWNVHYIIHDFESLDSKVRNQFISFVYVYKNLKNFVDDTAPIRRFLPAVHSVSKYPFKPSDKLPEKGRISRHFFVLKEIHKAYSTEQRFLPRSDYLETVSVNSLVTQHHNLTGLFISFTDSIVVVDGKSFLDTRSNYTVLPPRFVLPVVGKRYFMKTLFMLLVFFVSAYYVYSYFNKNESVENLPVAAVNDGRRLNVGHCEFFTSAAHVSDTLAKSFSRDYLIQLIINYDFKLSDVYDWGGRPRFSMFFSNKKGVIDSADSLELEVYGWQTFYWKKGVVLNRGDMWLFLESPQQSTGTVSKVANMFD